MSTTIDQVRNQPTVRSAPRRHAVWVAGLIAGLAASGATELVAAGARTMGVTVAAGNVGAEVAEPIAVGGFAIGTLTCVFWGTVLAVCLARWARRPASTFRRVALILTMISVIPPLSAVATSGAKVTLVVAHLVAAAIVIPILTGQLSRGTLRH